MALFGADFQRAKSEWLYPHEVQQTLWRGLGLFAALTALNLILQNVSAVATYWVLFGQSAAKFWEDSAGLSSEIMKSSIIGMLPSAILVVALTLYFMRFGLRGGLGRLPLRVPQLGIVGWFVVIGGFSILMYGVFIGTFIVLSIDPETYSPAGGLNNGESASGLVEKTIADLASQPLLFALALPGVILAAPITEELLFRGVLFSALVHTRLGRIGTVVVTSALWAGVHLMAAPWLYVGVIFIMGLVLGVLLLRYGSLWVTIACHAAWNTFNSLAIFGIGAHS